MRPFAFYEYDPTDGVTDPSGDVDPSTNPDPEPAPEPTPDEWVGPSRDEWEGMLHFAQQAFPILQAVSQADQNPTEPTPDPEPTPDFDPFQPDTVQRYVQSQIEKGMQTAMGQYEPVLNAFQAREGEQLARQELGRLKETIGEFDEDTALLLSGAIVNTPGVDPRLAVEQAARFVFEREEAIRAAERERITGEQKRLSERHGDLPAGGSAAVESQKVPTGPDRYREVVENWRAGRAPGMPIG